MKKKYILCGIVGIIVALLIVGCRTKKAVVTIIPCEAETVDDSLYIRELGHGISPNLQFSREKALRDAKFKIINRFCDSVRTYMPHVDYNTTTDSLFVGFKDTILFRYPISFFGELSYTRKECEKITFDANHQYHCFITLALPKEDFRHADDKIMFSLINYMADLSVQLRKEKEKQISPSDSIVLPQ